MMENQVYHIPALLGPTLEGMAIRPDGTYADLTFGGGGHSKAIMQQLNQRGRLFSFDQDIDAYANRLDDTRFCFVHGNFRYLKNFMHYYGVSALDGILADLGVSFHHFDTAQRGFSFRYSSPLDMRMNTSAAITAADIVNTYTEEQLTNIFRLYGECANPKRIAHTIALKRQTTPITTTDQLVDLLSTVILHDKEKKEMARVFQALRIEVNDEMGALKQMLNAALDMLRPGGRLVILTYHSIEDRIVKNFMRSGNIEGKIEKDFYGNTLSPFLIINNKVITATPEEVESNPRARSAKLRIAQKK